MVNFFGTYGGHLCGFVGFLTAIAALLYARARVAEFEASVRDLDWQQVSEISLDVAKLKSSSEVAEQFERARKNNAERLARASLHGASHAAKSHGAADKKG